VLARSPRVAVRNVSSDALGSSCARRYAVTAVAAVSGLITEDVARSPVRAVAISARTAERGSVASGAAVAAL